MKTPRQPRQARMPSTVLPRGVSARGRTSSGSNVRNQNPRPRPPAKKFFPIRWRVRSRTLRRRPGDGPSAFTLIEVVIAVAVFAMAAVVLSSTFVNALLAREAGQSNDRFHSDVQAVRLQLLLEPNLDDAEDGGRIETLSNGDANWSAQIEPTNVVDLFRVRLFVEFSDPAEERFRDYSETLFLLRPTWSESDERSDLLQEKKEALRNQRDFGF